MTRAYLLASVAGEMAATDIPLSSAVSETQLQALLAGDDDPCQVVIEVAPGKSSRGWHYTDGALQKLVAHVEQRSLSGILGHQREEDMSTEFRTPVTHWVGARWADGKAFFRGVVDKTAPDLKRWIRSGRVTQPSIFTRPTLARNARGEQEVVDLEPLSIDWAPLDRAGMSTARVVAWGEMADGESSGTRSGTTTPEGGTRGMTYTDWLAEAPQHQRAAHLIVVDLAEGRQDFRDLGERAGVAGELSTKLGKPPGELVATVTDLSTTREQALTDLGAIGEMTGKPPTEARAGVAALKQERDTLKAENEALLRDGMEQRLKTACGEMKVPEALRDALMPQMLPVAMDKRSASVEDAKGVVGEFKAKPEWKALFDATFTGQPITPATSRNGQGDGKPDMSIFGSVASPISV